MSLISSFTIEFSWGLNLNNTGLVVRLFGTFTNPSLDAIQMLSPISNISVTKERSIFSR